jgi:hypothetical protein
MDLMIHIRSSSNSIAISQTQITTPPPPPPVQTISNGKVQKNTPNRLRALKTCRATVDHCPSVEIQFVNCKVKSKQACSTQLTSFAARTSLLTSGSLKSSFVAINPAGKGSSLEAIAQVSFPPGSEALCLPRSLSCAALHSMQSTQASFHPGRGLQSREKAMLKFQYRPAKKCGP